MGEIVNLRQQRKVKARAERDAEAAANRVEHGRTKAEKKLTKAQTEQAKAKLDAHKRDKP